MAVIVLAVLPATAPAGSADLATKLGERPPLAWQPGEPCELCVLCLNPPCLMAVPVLASDFAHLARRGAESPRQRRAWLSRVWRLASPYIVPGIVAGAIVAAASR
jgi:hypothetical protein